MKTDFSSLQGRDGATLSGDNCCMTLALVVGGDKRGKTAERVR